MHICPLTTPTPSHSSSPSPGSLFPPPGSLLTLLPSDHQRIVRANHLHVALVARDVSDLRVASQASEPQQVSDSLSCVTRCVTRSVSRLLPHHALRIDAE